MNVPNNPIMLVSYINTQLRDFYPSLDELCQALSIDKDNLNKKLAGIDYHYNQDTNQFQ